MTTNSIHAVSVDPKLLEKIVAFQDADAPVCEECGQAVTDSGRLSPVQYAAWLRFFCAWLRLPSRQRDIIADMIVRPGLSSSAYCPRLKRTQATAVCNAARRHLSELLSV